MVDNALTYCKLLIKKNTVEFIDLKAIDLVGRLHHITLPYYDKILEKIMDYIDPKLCYMFFEADPNIAGKLKNLVEKKLNTMLVTIDKDYNQRERIVTVKIKDVKPK